MFTLRFKTRHFLKPSPLFLQIYRKKSTTAATIKSLDHLVLTVKSVPKTTRWYEMNLGMRSESFVSAATPAITRYSLIFGDQKINLHESSSLKRRMLKAVVQIYAF
ncbi:Glyoxalase domain-containing 5 [Hyphodiscus hymeniophilus]|uniref:Glyoxalase domain-containing 5 n=1 Tax=Hyphodiscus hymeniophilus TaxID=353542 RepID=A0A9P6SLA1_9HELO|nr:Glyoxalase domain-containing 5 [Hyphodiscus hymeniophilus]